ncbi:MAG TPA: transcriptional regulator [Bacteroidetes bacterium]|nr:transcriptional regulator [Bacteroidota bacterium]
MTKNRFSSEQLDRAANILKAIAHPMRISILNYLEEKGSLTVTEIHKLLGIEQSTTSHHLSILKDKGILGSKRDGKNTYYFLKYENINQILDCISKNT